MYNILHHAAAPGMRDARRRPPAPGPALSPDLRVVPTPPAPATSGARRSGPLPRGAPPEASATTPGG